MKAIHLTINYLISQNIFLILDCNLISATSPADNNLGELLQRCTECHRRRACNASRSLTFNLGLAELSSLLSDICRSYFMVN